MVNIGISGQTQSEENEDSSENAEPPPPTGSAPDAQLPASTARPEADSLQNSETSSLSSVQISDDSQRQEQSRTEGATVALAADTAVADAGSREAYREAHEVFLFMHKNIRVSRNVRARWFFEHLDQVTGINESLTGENDDGITVVGLVPKGGGTLVSSAEKLRVVSSTVLTYFSKLYRLIFIVDLSPSSFVADDSGCVLYTKLISSVIKCLRNVAKKVLLQGLLLSEDNVDEIAHCFERKISEFINKLCEYSRSHLRSTHHTRRKERNSSSNYLGNLFQQPTSNHDDNSSTPSSRCACPGSSDRGFVQPNWSLVSMLRMGLVAVQMLPENTQSNVVVVTDGVCGSPDMRPLQQVISQLRSYTVSCSFIQLNQSTPAGPAFGHVGFPELFSFMATATFGTFLFEDDLKDAEETEFNMFHKAFLAWNFQRALHNQVSPLPDLVLNSINHAPHRHKRTTYSYDTSLNKLLYVRLREGYTIKHVEILKAADGSESIFVKLCLPWRPNLFIEYHITAPWNSAPQKKYVEVVKSETILKSWFRCKIHVDVFIESHAGTAVEPPADRCDTDNMRTIMSNLKEADSLLIHLHSFNADPQYYQLPREFSNEYALFEYRRPGHPPVLLDRYECIRDTKFVKFWQPLCVLDESVWQKWVHTHTIRLMLAHDIPLPANVFTPTSSKHRFGKISAEYGFQALHDMLRSNSTFTLVRNETYVTMIHEDNDPVPRYFYFVRAPVDIPCVILKVAFLGGVSGIKRNAIVEDLKARLTNTKFEREVSYVISTENATSAYEGLPMRTIYSKHSHEELFVVLRKPMERILAKYRKVPRCVHQIVRLEQQRPIAKQQPKKRFEELDTTEARLMAEREQEIRDMVLHNAIAKYLSCSRCVWYLQGVFPKITQIPNASIEYILQVLLRRRLNQGYNVAYGRNGIVNLVRQVQYPGECMPRIEQCVIFGPNLADVPIYLTRLSLVDGRYERETRARHAAGTSGTMESTKSSNPDVKWPQIITEVWTEPQGTVSGDADLVAQDRSLTLLEEDDRIVRTLFTFDQWSEACQNRGMDDRPLYMDRSPDDGCHEKAAPNVHIARSAFDLGLLLDNANAKELMLLPTMSFSDGDPHSESRLNILLKCLQKELAEYADASLEVRQESFLDKFTEKLEAQFSMSRYCRDRKSDRPARTTDREASNESDASDVDSSSSVTAASKSSSTHSTPSKDDKITRLPVAATGRRISTSSIDLKDTFNEDAVFEEHHGGSLPKVTTANENASGPFSPCTQKPLPSPVKSLQASAACDRSTSVPLLSVEDSSLNRSYLATLGPSIGLGNAGGALLGASPVETASSAGISASTGNMLNPNGRYPASTSARSSTDLRLSPQKRLRIHTDSRLGIRSLALPEHSTKEAGAEASAQQEMTVQSQVPPSRALKVYARRLSSSQIVFFVIPKDMKTLLHMMPGATLNTFPAVAYFCDRPIMAQKFAECDVDEVQGSAQIHVENFCRKAETSTLAQLSRQISRRSFSSTSAEAGHVELFYVTGNDVPPDSEEPLHIKVDLTDYCERIFEEYIFTRSFVSAVYTCLGQEIFVPSSLLNELTEFRCDHTNIEIGSINEILRATCAHLARERQRNRTERSRMKSIHSQKSSASGRLFPEIASTSESSADEDGEDYNGRISFMSKESADTMSEADNPSPICSEEAMAVCEDELNEFRQAFDILLRTHSFIRVPGLVDYFFYRPRETVTTELPNLDDMEGPPANVSFSDVTARESISNENNLSVHFLDDEEFSNGNNESFSDNSSEVERLSHVSGRSAGSGDGEFTPSDERWPLLIQFSAAVHLPDSGMDTFPIEFIPSCMQKIVDKCNRDMMPQETDLNLEELT
ncbi:Protein F54B3.1 a [Aphelenchoides avenae]|nr:Protein F54B3.1 a [Aphelenchus avenae]